MYLSKLPWHWERHLLHLSKLMILSFLFVHYWRKGSSILSDTTLCFDIWRIYKLNIWREYSTGHWYQWLSVLRSQRCWVWAWYKWQGTSNIDFDFLLPNTSMFYLYWSFGEGLCSCLSNGKTSFLYLSHYFPLPKKWRRLISVVHNLMIWFLSLHSLDKIWLLPKYWRLPPIIPEGPLNTMLHKWEVYFNVVALINCPMSSTAHFACIDI